MSRARHFLSLMVLSITLLISGWAQAQDRLTVVELFTSQGCSSCPPADALLGELTGRDDVLALSFHVDYWDYIGWPDTFGSRENTERQRAYAKAMGNWQIYTPQMVVGGRHDVVGSNRLAVERALAAEQEDNARQELDIRFTQMDDHIQVKIGDTALQGKATIWLVRYDNTQTVQIQRGENRGREISYHNVVRELSSLGLYSGKAMQIDLSMDRLKHGGRDGCAVIIQQDRSGPVLGAARLAWATQ